MTAAILVAAASGFIALSYEILWYRVIAFASWGLASAFGLLLAAYLFGIAVGARFAGRFCKDDAAAGDPRQLRAIAAFALVANLAAWLVVPISARLAARWDWVPILACVAVAAGLLGAIFPLVAHFGVAPDKLAGQRISYMYLANIVGSAAGSFVTGFVLLDHASIAQVFTIVGVLGVALVAALVWRSDLVGPRRTTAVAATLAATLALVLGTPRAYDRIWERFTYKAKLTDDTRFADVIETRSGVITVTPDGTVYGGGAYDGRFNTSIVHDRNGILRAYAIGALHAAPRRVLMIGLASGSWATVISHLPGLEHLEIVEINPGYLDLIRKHEEVAGILDDPKVHIAIDDGRRWLHRHQGADAEFDVIVMNTTWHWRAHITDLLSSEFMDLARAHLRPGGLFFFNTTSSDDVQKTAATAFPYAIRVYNFMAVSDAPLAFDEDRWRRVLRSLEIGGAPVIDVATEAGRALYEDLATYADTIHAPPVHHGLESRESVLARTVDARVVTDDNMLPEWRQIFRFQDPP